MSLVMFVQLKKSVNFLRFKGDFSPTCIEFMLGCDTKGQTVVMSTKDQTARGELDVPEDSVAELTPVILPVFHPFALTFPHVCVTVQ